METAGIERALRSNFGLRTSPAMREYVMKQLESGTAKEIPIIASDARTGRSIRAVIPAAALQHAMN